MVSLITLYNLMLLPVDLAVLFAIWQIRKFRAVAAGMVVQIVATLVVASLLSNTYMMIRLTSIGWFGHLPMVLLLGAIISRRRSKKMAIASAVIATVILVVGIDAFLIEPAWLQETRYTVTSEKITDPIQIVILADIQMDEFTSYERDVFKRSMELQPDMILMAGDYLQVGGSRFSRLRTEVNEYLREINFHAPLGVYAVQGNNDSQGWTEIFQGLPVQTAVETSRVDTGAVRVTSLSMRDSFRTDVKVPAADPFQIVLGHSPNFALGDVRGDLLVAGHTHGGQVRIPGFGPIVTLSAVPRAWAVGMTQIDDHKTLIVSRGIGMERADAPRLRFFCRPELAIVDVVPARSASATSRELGAPPAQ